MNAKDLGQGGPSISREAPAETVEKFSAHLRAQGYADRTVDTYLYHARKLALWLTARGTHSFADLRPEQLREYQVVLATRPGRRGAGLTAWTRLAIAIALLQFARFLANTGRAVKDLADAISLPRVTKKLPDNVLTVKEMERLLAAPAIDDPVGLRDRALMELLYATGLRQTEALDLRVDDVDLGVNEVRVRRGKGGQSRIAPVGREAVAALSAYLAESRSVLTRDGDSGFFFVSGTGARLDPSSMHKMFKRYAVKVGIKRPVGFHTFRHSVATHLMQRGAGLRYIQELLGHKSLGSTQIYTRVTIADLKRAHARFHPRERMDV